MGLLDKLFGGGASPQQIAAAPAPAGGGARDFISALGPAIALLDPRNQQLGGALMQMQLDKKAGKAKAAKQNQTAQWLMTEKGMDEGTASYLASDPDALRGWYKAQMPDWQVDMDSGQMVDKNTGQVQALKGWKAPQTDWTPRKINTAEGEVDVLVDKNGNMKPMEGAVAKSAKTFRPLVDQAEREAAGIQPADKRPYQIGADGKVDLIGGGQTINVLSPGDKDFVRDTKTMINSRETSLKQLESILSGAPGETLNDKAGAGYLAKTQSWLARNANPGGVLFDEEQGKATTNLDNIATSAALEALKPTFGGNPTEGERKILQELQASSSFSVDERRDILTRAIAMGKAKLAREKEAVAEMLGGDYYGQGGSGGSGATDPNLPPAPAGVSASDWQYMTPEERAAWQ